MKIIKLKSMPCGQIFFRQSTFSTEAFDACAWEFMSGKFRFESQFNFKTIEEAIENWNEFAETVNGGCGHGNQTEADE